MKPNERLMSLDALRGADMLCIMGASSAVMAFCALLGMPDCWLALQMKHVAWHGFRHHDTIFPLFLFLAGVSWPFSFASQEARGRSAGRRKSTSPGRTTWKTRWAPYAWQLP